MVNVLSTSAALRPHIVEYLHLHLSACHELYGLGAPTLLHPLSACVSVTSSNIDPTHQTRQKLVIHITHP